VIGKVTNVQDPENLGRIEVTYPWLSESNRSRWASVASIMAGPERGAFFMPEIDDEVLITFEHGDWDHPYVIGFLWNEVQRPPSATVHQRVVCSVNGQRIRILDPEPTGDGNTGAIVIEDGNGNKISMTNSVMRISCRGQLEINATGSIHIGGRPLNKQGGII
jgi:uncharacterized protein involved in type VI secretion and phage assembly